MYEFGGLGIIGELPTCKFRARLDAEWQRFGYIKKSNRIYFKGYTKNNFSIPQLFTYRLSKRQIRGTWWNLFTILSYFLMTQKAPFGSMQVRQNVQLRDLVPQIVWMMPSTKYCCLRYSPILSSGINSLLPTEQLSFDVTKVALGSTCGSRMCNRKINHQKGWER
jgi:hypothetical protein